MMPLCRLGTIALVALAALGAARDDHRLADAVERRDSRAIESLLAGRADVNGVQADGATALHWAVYWDDRRSVDAIVGAGANVNAANDHGVTPLALAAENRNDVIVEKLLAAGANPNAAISTGETVLMTASRAGSPAVVKALIARGAEINRAEPGHGQTALMWAISERHADVVLLLLNAGADANARSRVRHRTVQLSTRYGDQNSVRGVTEIDLGGFTPLLFAARVGDVESAGHLLTKGAQVNDTAPSGASALVVAAHSGQTALARLLVERGADINAHGAGYSALHAAVLRGDLDLVKVLLSRGADPNLTLAKGTPSRYYSKDYAFNDNLVGASPFWLAARFGEPAIMSALAAAGADPRGTLPDGTTALMAAVIPTRGLGAFRLGDRRERYQGPADIAAKADGEDEALTIATASRAIDLGVDVNAANKDGDTALHMAAGLALGPAIEFLVKKGASLGAKNQKGLTPLAVTSARPERGAQGQVVYGFLTAEERERTAKLLRALGATE